MRKPNRFLHRMGFIISPSLMHMGVGPYSNPIAKRNWKKVYDRIARVIEIMKEDE